MQERPELILGGPSNVSFTRRIFLTIGLVQNTRSREHGLVRLQRTKLRKRYCASRDLTPAVTGCDRINDERLCMCVHTVNFSLLLLIFQSLLPPSPAKGSQPSSPWLSSLRFFIIPSSLYGHRLCSSAPLSDYRRSMNYPHCRARVSKGCSRVFCRRARTDGDVVAKQHKAASPHGRQLVARGHPVDNGAGATAPARPQRAVCVQSVQSQ